MEETIGLMVKKDQKWRYQDQKRQEEEKTPGRTTFPFTTTLRFIFG